MPPRAPRGDVRAAAQARRAGRAEAEEATASPASEDSGRPPEEPNGRRWEAHPGGADIAIRDDQDWWTDRQVAALTAMGLKNPTRGDLAVFMHVCHRTGLDPFAKQIYMIARREYDPYTESYVTKQTIQVGIDGFRVVRDRAERKGGFICEFEDTIWYDADGTEYTTWVKADIPAACKVVLVKKYADGTRARFPATLRTAPYIALNRKKEPAGRWKDMPDHMIEKCCEAQASRRACPQDLSGLYIAEEMQGAEPGPGRGRYPSLRATVEGQDETLPPDPAGPDPDLEDHRQSTLRGLHAVFSEHGWGGDSPEAHRVRVNVLAVLARQDETGPPITLGSTAELDAWQADRAAAGLRALIAEISREEHPERRNTHDRLAALADAVDKVRAEQAEAAPAGEPS